MLKNSIKGTILSVLVFFSISFLTVLKTIISPIYLGVMEKLSVGWPYIYYEQYQHRGSSYLYYNWDVKHLLIDCVLYWIVIAGSYVLIKFFLARKSNL